jgi:hypothetical protein
MLSVLEKMILIGKKKEKIYTHIMRLGEGNEKRK